MPVRIFCKCGQEITGLISNWDMKTRTLSWMDEHTPSCPACRKKAEAAQKRGWAQNARVAESRKKAAAG